MRTRATMVGLAAMIGTALALAPQTPAPAVVARLGGAPVVQIPLAWSNVFLVEGSALTLIDAGSPGDETALRDALAARGHTLDDVRNVVLTHGHADHVGLAASLRGRGARIIAGRRERAMLAARHDPPLRPTGAFAWLLQYVVPHERPSVEADVWIDDRLDLRAFGIDAEAVAIPGHTPGSIAVVGGELAFVGDLLRGGELGGAVDPATPHEHYFHDDRAAAREQLRALLAGDARVLLVGHGGPIESASVGAMGR